MKILPAEYGFRPDHWTVFLFGLLVFLIQDQKVFPTRIRDACHSAILLPENRRERNANCNYRSRIHPTTISVRMNTVWLILRLPNEGAASNVDPPGARNPILLYWRVSYRGAPLDQHECSDEHRLKGKYRLFRVCRQADAARHLRGIHFHPETRRITLGPIEKKELRLARTAGWLAEVFF